MKTRLAILMTLFSVFLSAQLEMNYSYEMKYWAGKQVTPESQDTTDYSYFENLLDINTYYGDNIYIYSQLEYSNPPVFGYSRTGLDSMLNAFYIEYSHERFNVKLGDLYELYGRGLSFYTMQDQTIDHDNSIRGLALNYSLKENLEISTLIGMGDYAYRFNAASDTTDRSFMNNVVSTSINYENGFLGFFQYLYLNQHSIIEAFMIEKYRKPHTELGIDLLEREDLGIADTIINKTHNLNWNYYSSIFDIYVDKSWINYDKMYGQQTFGSRFYSSIYTEIFGTGITYEYKNYYTPYLIKSISNPPIVYRESNSILASRNVHSMNFGNEIGHQIDFNKDINGNYNVIGNLAISYRHQKEEMADLTLVDFLSMKEDPSIYTYYPFRQVYMEINGWELSERLYFKIGMDHFTEYLNGKNIFALTIPTQWVWELTNGSSFTIYLETQEKIVNKLSPIDPPDVDEYINHYLSVSYSHFGRWIITGFYDYEKYSKKMIRDPDTFELFSELTTVSSPENQWPGLDFSFFFTSATQISFFYGSQKGGLVCANGICAEQPGFEDGYKITFRSLF